MRGISAEVTVRGRTAVIAALTTALLGSGAGAYAVVHRHPAAPPSTPVVAAGAPVHAAPVRTSPGVAPLRHLVEPDLFVTTTHPMSAATLRHLRRSVHARSMTLLDVGGVRIAGRVATAVGVDLSAFRGYTPPPTAASDLLWQNLAGGDVAISYNLARHRRLAPGEAVSVGRRSDRLGAVAAFGLPKIDLVVAKPTGASLGLHPRQGVLISSPGRSAATLAADARAVLGRQARIVPLQQDASATFTGRPRTYRELYQVAARTCPGLSWTILAAIGQVESDHGRNVGPSTAGALGPMQFLPATWTRWGVDADGDHKADIMDPYDTVYSAARYLCWFGAGHGGADLKRAVFAYNHAQWYVTEVIALARLYG
jgi:hypothetical protein